VFQLFLRARANNYFKARSAGRYTETAASVFRSIEDSLDGAKAEQAGLKSRIDDVLARAAITQGNNSDEYLTRDTEGSHYQSLLNTEIANGQLRLNELGVTIGHCREKLDLDKRPRLEGSEPESALQPAPTAEHHRRESPSFWQSVKTTMFK
jgi:hypothetical protein